MPLLQFSLVWVVRAHWRAMSNNPSNNTQSTEVEISKYRIRLTRQLPLLTRRPPITSSAVPQNEHIVQGQSDLRVYSREQTFIRFSARINANTTSIYPSNPPLLSRIAQLRNRKHERTSDPKTHYTRERQATATRKTAGMPHNPRLPVFSPPVSPQNA
jgi:hypothetical protein